MTWTELPFGKHTGRTLPQILFADPGWFFWVHRKQALRGRLEFEVGELFPRATRIRIPQGDGERCIVEYAVHPSGGLATVQLVPETAVREWGGSGSFTRPWIDLSIAQQIRGYDQTGGKILIDFLKTTYFGSTCYKMTRDRCAEFFESPGNFVSSSALRQPGLS